MNTVPPHDLHAGDRPVDTVPPLQRPKPTRTRRTFWFLVFLVIAVVLLGGLGWFEYVFKPKMIAQFMAASVPPPTAVSTYKADAESVPQYLETIGTLLAVRQVTVSPEVEGRIATLNFESGNLVKAGDVLVQLDDAQERADLASLQAQSRLANVNLTRARQLASKQFGSKQDVDQQQSLLDQANAGIAKSQSQIAYKAIKAPFNGMLGMRQVNLGQYLAPGAAIVSLTDLDELYVDFTLPEQNRTQLSIGQAVDLRFDAYPDRVFRATIMTLDPQVDPNMRAIRVRGDLPNPDHALQPGMYARVSVVLPPLANVVTLPEAAIDYTVYGDSVYVVKDGKDQAGKPLLDKDGKPQLVAEQSFVTVGQRFNGKVAVTKGVAVGDLVVVGGQLKLHNGATVSLSQDKSLEDTSTLPKE